jgi:hypothetical protein
LLVNNPQNLKQDYIYGIGLQSNCVQKVTFNEIVVSETSLPMPPNKINAVVERDIVIRNVSEEELLNY